MVCLFTRGEVRVYCHSFTSALTSCSKELFSITNYIDDYKSQIVNMVGTLDILRVNAFLSEQAVEEHNYYIIDRKNQETVAVLTKKVLPKRKQSF